MKAVRFLPTVPEELNRILILIHEHGGANGIKTNTLLEIAAASTYGASLPDHRVALRFAELLGLTKRRGERLHISAIGASFLQQNPQTTYELTESQAETLTNLLLTNEACLKLVQQILKQGLVDFRRGVFAFSIGSVKFSDDEVNMLSLLRRLGFLGVRESKVEIAERFRQIVLGLLAPKKMSLAELERLIEERRIQGFEAEEWVLAHERKRLEDAGYTVEAASVSLISRFDVTAGYDIESFDASSVDLVPDRFIEVKSTSSDEQVFYISANELSTAKREGQKYWIYHLRRFAKDSANLSTLRDPAALVKQGKITLKPQAYKASFG